MLSYWFLNNTSYGGSPIFTGTNSLHNSIGGKVADSGFASVGGMPVLNSGTTSGTWGAYPGSSGSPGSIGAMPVF
jgi:hypothetical protein